MPSTKFKETGEVGFVVAMKEYLIYLEGIPSARINDVLESETGGRAIVASLEDDRVAALRLDSFDLRPGDRFSLVDKKIFFPANSGIFGRILNPLGAALDGKGVVSGTKIPLAFDTVALGIDSRELIDEQFLTGISIIDMLVPLGKGQRELLIGPLQSGKTSFMRDIIANQKGQKRICIYTALGKSASAVYKFAEAIFSAGADGYTVVIAANASETVPIISIAPTVAFGIADYFRSQGKDVLLILDDLGTHAKYLREIGLLSGKIPGRGSYPGDIFFQHAHLMERAGNFNKNAGGGSVTLLPVMETDIENFSELIPTNLMASTDGHLFFSSLLRAQGFFPPVEIERSVSRVGRQTQTAIQKAVAEQIRSLLSKYRELQEYAGFGSELSMETQDSLKKGAMMMHLLRQEPHEYIDCSSQIILLGLSFTSFLDHRDTNFVKANRVKILTWVKSKQFEDVVTLISNNGKADAFFQLLEQKVPYLEKLCHT